MTRPVKIALAAAALGWHIIPCRPDSKRPESSPGMAENGLNDATTDEATIRAWWKRSPDSMPAVVTGPSGIAIADIDVKDGNDGFAVLDDLGHEIPYTPVRRDTPNGGTHFFYRADPLIEQPNGTAHLFRAEYAAKHGYDLSTEKGKKKSETGIDRRTGKSYAVLYAMPPSAEEVAALPAPPDWLYAERTRADGTTSSSIDRAPAASEETYRRRLRDGKPDKDVRAALANVKSKGMGHDDMLRAVTELVTLGVRGHRGVGPALDAARETYARGWGDAARHWDNAVAGSIRRLGLPPATIPLSKAERKEIKRRNSPEEVERADKLRRATFRVEKHAQALSHPEPGTRLLEDGPLAVELAAVLVERWAYSSTTGLMRYHEVGDAGMAGRWKPAEEHSLSEAVRRLLAEIEVEEHQYAVMLGEKALVTKALTLLSRAKVGAVARLVLGILAENEPAFDAHPDLLNTPSGVVDLRTKKLLPAHWSMYLTKMTSVGYDPDADMTRWMVALEAVPAKTAAWLQIRLGQAATGYTPDDDVMLIFEGAGANGKTTFAIATRRALGDYAVTLPDRLLLGDPGDHPTTLMNLKGARWGVIEELPEGRTLNVKRLKDSVGTTEITARRMRRDDETFQTTHALGVNTNYLPIVAETDHGTWRRLALVRFPYRFVKKRKKIKSTRDRLGDPRIRRHFEKSEGDAGVLRWMIEGAYAWYQAGMMLPDPPKRVEKDTQKWRLEADPILAYVRDRIVRDDDFGITATDLADDFNMWLERRGHKAWSQQTINSRFQGHVTMDGVEKKMVRWSHIVKPSRPKTVLTGKPLPKTTTAWRGIRFIEDATHIPSEAEHDAAVLAALEKGLTPGE